jgi:hypothetical protein
VHTLITDTDAPPDVVAGIVAAGVEVQQA